MAIWGLVVLSILIFLGVGIKQKTVVLCTTTGSSLASVEVLLTDFQIGYRQKMDKQKTDKQTDSGVDRVASTTK